VSANHPEPDAEADRGKIHNWFTCVLPDIKAMQRQMQIKIRHAQKSFEPTRTHFFGRS